MNDMGFHVFDIDYRLTPPERWIDASTDVESALIWLKENAKRYGVDLGRVSVIGHSAGAHLAMLAAYTGNGIPIKSVVNVYGPSELTLLYFSTGSEGYLHAILKQFLGGAPDEFPKRYRNASPVHQVKPGLPPTITVFGESDRVVPASQGIILDKALNEAGVVHEFYLMPATDRRLLAIK